MLTPLPPGRSVRWAVGDLDLHEAAFVTWLRGQVREAGWREAANDGSADLTVVWSHESLEPPRQRELLDLAASGSPVLLCGPTLASLVPGSELAEAAGVLVDRRTPAHEVRVKPHPGDHWPSGFAPAPVVCPDVRVMTVAKLLDDVDELFSANVALREHPVVTRRVRTGISTLTLEPAVASAPSSGVPVMSETRASSANPPFARLLLVTMHGLTSRADQTHPEVRVGLLGYGAIGAEHSKALMATPGLAFAGVCDRSHERLDAAMDASREARAFGSAGELIASDEVDLVVVSTPPDAHARWTLEALRAGKHVVVEKPFALTAADADAVLDTASAAGLLAVVYQNRRFDPDFRAIKRAVELGQLGEVFRLEAFIGGYGHPCNFWHSDELVSGGAIFDWGAHVLDQILDLKATEIDYVTGSEHKLVWHDVSNADHSRVTLRFVDGSEAEFVHSDIAASLKPRWYILGTDGAIVGTWRHESVIARSEIGTLAEDVLAPADSPPVITLQDREGSTTQLSPPPASPWPFHAELADYLHYGIPMSISGRQSRRVLSVMEAARHSALSGGRPVTPA